MKEPVTDLLGRRFSQLVVMGFSHSDGNQRYFRFRCDCGTEKTLPINQVKFGSIKSCGCLLKERCWIIGDRTRKHGMTGTRTYRSWSHMKGRCNDLNNKHYGGRGITYCEEWEDFRNFFRDMGERPLGTTLDRINPNLNYTPDNCRWATKMLQRHNRRDSSRANK